MKFQHLYREIHFFMNNLAENSNFQHFFDRKEPIIGLIWAILDWNWPRYFSYDIRYFYFQKIRYKFQILKYRATPAYNRICRIYRLNGFPRSQNIHTSFCDFRVTNRHPRIWNSPDQSPFPTKIDDVLLRNRNPCSSVLLYWTALYQPAPTKLCSIRGAVSVKTDAWNTRICRRVFLDLCKERLLLLIVAIYSKLATNNHFLFLLNLPILRFGKPVVQIVSWFQFES